MNVSKKNDTIFILLLSLCLFLKQACVLKVQMTVGKCLLFLYPVPVPPGYSRWSVSAQLKHIPSCQGFSSMFWSYLSAHSQYSCPTVAENIKRAELLSPTTPFSHSTHGCLGFCAIAERLWRTQKVPEWKTWPVRCRNMCRLKSHLQLCLAPLFLLSPLTLRLRSCLFPQMNAFSYI